MAFNHAYERFHFRQCTGTDPPDLSSSRIWRFSFCNCKSCVIIAMILSHWIRSPIKLFLYKIMFFIYSLVHHHPFMRVYEEPTPLNDLLPAGLLTQMVERCTDITEVREEGFTSVQAWITFQAFFSQLQKMRLYMNYDDLFFHLILHWPADHLHDSHICIIFAGIPLKKKTTTTGATMGRCS